MDFSPDGRLLAACADPDTFKIWNWRDGTGRPHSLRMKSILYSVRFSPDGQYIVVTMGSNMVILNARTGQFIRELRTTLDLRSVVFTPDGMDLVVGSWDGVVECVDISPLRLVSLCRRMGSVVSTVRTNLTFRRHDVCRFLFSKSLLKLTSA